MTPDRGLAGAVGPLEEDHLRRVHVEVDAGQGGEPAEEAHGVAKVDHGLHGDFDGIGHP